MRFENTKLNDNIKKGIKAMKFDKMTDIQEKTMDLILEGKNIIAMSNTGTGKTAAFMLPLLNNIDINNNSIQVLVITPTRELAIQIVQETKKYCKYVNNINPVAIYGGQEIKMQAISIRKGAKVIVGTPGRLLELLNKKVLKIGNLRTLVLDEADELLNMGFEQDINLIFSFINENVQKLLFSATMTDKIQNIFKDKIKNPIYIQSKQNKTMLVDSINQIAIEVKENFKPEVTLRILKKNNAKNSIVFCNTKKKTEEVANFLRKSDIKLEVLNSDIRQEERENILNRLKKGLLDTIVVTDVLSRGIDIKDLELVINYDIPFEVEYYVHRIGRTARQGKSGTAYIFYTGKQINKLKEIEKYTKSKLIFEDVPVKIKNNENLELSKNKRGFYEVRLSIGKDNNIKSKDIVGAMGSLVGIKSNQLGIIQVNEKDSIVEIPEEYINDVLSIFNNAKIKENDVHILK